MIVHVSYKQGVAQIAQLYIYWFINMIQYYYVYCQIVIHIF